MTEVQKIKDAVKYIALHLNEYNIDELKETLFDYYDKLTMETTDGRIVRSMVLALYNLACQVMVE